MTTSVKATIPSLQFLLRHPSHFVALGFGSGLSPKAPGSIGTIIGLPLFWMLTFTPEPTHCITLAVLFLVGIPLCTKTGNALGVSDHGSIVWDEIVAIMLVLEFTPASPLWWGIAFVLFRLFDIWKPAPIRHCDARLKGGFGVMFDDLLAAIYAIISLKVLLCLALN
ncbi:phosphatidylglycerophosphatase A [Candidatus Methylopumilus turicensis]|uniref:Phosphatidylglycerophosphatase A n=1 Tax=Candidatus Methylopumilus turicensis TaxID=1581680 RepID=A0A0B7IZ82_9PROT|nr:phosphatidylglycerophosphatase A [Candidatus Methylopumilus turicensis]CEN56424.1 Phosphatidylglycerophosphatase A [Candidatus Methylopumilus turicensis]